MTLLATGPNIRKRGRPRNYPSEEQRREARTIQRRHQRRRQFARAAEAANDAAQITSLYAGSCGPRPRPVGPASLRSSRRVRPGGSHHAGETRGVARGPPWTRRDKVFGRVRGGSDSSIDGITKGEIR
ncbi:uncharacterized protein N7473_004332 [Penicillium subrubescens]|uniref:uncharacterized protein n=1 Tax=Penicillium subrubescens TaxID=1316194 RepID=UPI002544ED9B|nr:uncharacterized protein N7473_004332 [Penicillium subrubescens]KAJ5900262.1 hypothetical protein N7473_004332 [Penicillium subrubescens]